MGWFNKSSSSQNEVTTQNVGADNGAIALNANESDVNFVMTDQGAVNSAFAFGADAFDFAENVNRSAIESLNQTFEETIGAVSDRTAQIVDKVTIDSGERVEKSMRAMAWVAVAAIVGFAIIGRRAKA